MRPSDPLDADLAERQVTLGELLQPVLRHRGYVLLVTLVVTAVAGLAAGVVYLRQGATRNAVLGLRLVFPGAAFGIYPNGQPFLPTDIIDGSVVDAVFAEDHLASYCTPDAFRSGLVVAGSSADLTALNAMFESRMADPRTNAVDHQRLADEYTSRRAAIPAAFDLRYVDPSACVRIPDGVLANALTRILETWAGKTQQVDGVARFDTAVLTPAVFDDDSAAGAMPFVRADLLRTRLTRVIANIRAIEALPGAGQIRGGDPRVTLAEVRGRLEDLVRTRLDPFIADLSRDPQSHGWLAQALVTARTEAAATERRAEVYYTALDEYSRGGAATPPSPTGSVPPQPKPRTEHADALSAAEQVDRTLVDRIVELSAASTVFRQEQTRQAVAASLDAVDRRAAVARYEALLAGPSGGSAIHLPSSETDKVLKEILSAAKRETAQFNQIYVELSRVSLRAGANLYRIERPLEIEPVRALSVGRLVNAVIAVAIVTPIVLALMLLFFSHGRQIVASTRSGPLRK